MSKTQTAPVTWITASAATRRLSFIAKDLAKDEYPPVSLDHFVVAPDSETRPLPPNPLTDTEGWGQVACYRDGIFR